MPVTLSSRLIMQLTLSFTNRCKTDHGLTPVSARSSALRSSAPSLPEHSCFVSSRFSHGRLRAPRQARVQIRRQQEGLPQSSWAVVTGATDGIGRVFAIQLAKKGFNILLVSRSPEKLGSVAAEIEAASPGVRTKTQAIDFALGDERQYEGLEHTVKDLNIGVLVNNVGKSHNMPVTFAETTEEEMEDIIEINVVSVLRVFANDRSWYGGSQTRIDPQPRLVCRSGHHPMLATYAGSKSFLSGWSQALGEELSHSGVQVSLLNTYFVVSNLSKIRKSSAMIPTPSSMLRRCSRRLVATEARWQAVHRDSVAMHALVDWATTFVLPRGWLLRYTYGQQVATRKRAIRKAEKAIKST